MRRMSDPNYSYTPWPPERRAEASRRAKADWERRNKQPKKPRESQDSELKRSVKHSLAVLDEKLAEKLKEIDEIRSAIKVIQTLCDRP